MHKGIMMWSESRGKNGTFSARFTQPLEKYIFEGKSTTHFIQQFQHTTEPQFNRSGTILLGFNTFIFLYL